MNKTHPADAHADEDAEDVDVGAEARAAKLVPIVRRRQKMIR